MAKEQKIKELKPRCSLELLNQKDVSGVGVEKNEVGDFVLAIHLNDALPEKFNLPSELEKYPVKFIRQPEGFRKVSAETEK